MYTYTSIKTYESWYSH